MIRSLLLAVTILAAASPGSAALYTLNYSFTSYSHPISFGAFFDEPLVVGAGDTVDITIRFDQPYRSIRPFTGGTSVSLFTGIYSAPRRGSIGTATITLLDPVGVPNTYGIVDIDGGGGSGDLGMHATMVLHPESTSSPVSFTGIRVVYDVTSGPPLDYISFQFNATALPEATTWAMMISGFGLLGGAARRSRRASPTFAYGPAEQA